MDPENGHFRTDEGLFDSTCAPSSSSAEVADGVEVVLAAATHSMADVAGAAVKVLLVVEAGGPTSMVREGSTKATAAALTAVAVEAGPTTSTVQTPSTTAEGEVPEEAEAAAAEAAADLLVLTMSNGN
jgi:hypothetical protein